MNEKLNALKAELMMKTAGFMLQKHENPILKRLSSAMAWTLRNRHGQNTLEFLEDESSIDHLDYSRMDVVDEEQSK